MKKVYLVFLLFAILSTAIAQPDKKKPKNVEAKELDAAVKSMHKLGKSKAPKGVCGADASIFRYPSTNEFSWASQLKFFKKKIAGFDKLTYLKKGFMASGFDHAFLAFDSKDKFSDFVKKVSNIPEKDLSQKQKKKLKELHQFFGMLMKETRLVAADTRRIEGCYVEMNVSLGVARKNHAGVRWKIRTEVNMTCDCKNPKTKYKVEELKYEYSTVIDGSLSASKVSFAAPKDATFKILKKKCCPETEVGLLEEPFIDPPKTENVSLPDHLLGGSAGVAFAQNFDETSFCLGAEYLYNFTDLGQSPLYVGGHANLATTSFMDSSRTWVSVGPTVQLFSPVTPSGQTQITNGVSGAYIFGTNDNGGFKDDVSGFEISLNTGFNIQVSQQVSISVVIPVLTHQNLTIESQDGEGSFKTDDTSLFINKNSPAKLGVRFGF